MPTNGNLPCKNRDYSPFFPEYSIGIFHCMTLRKAQFLISCEQFGQCPEDSGFEVAFAGRSNAGKSSALNTITGQNKLAKTSKTPGRTQLINFFSIDEERRLVDLPGYGFAKVPKAVKARWQKTLDQYLNERQALQGLVLLMDIRHPMKEFDVMMLNWAIEKNLPIHILLTKADKLKKGVAKSTLLHLQNELQDYSDLVSIQLFSSLKKSGVEEVSKVLKTWLRI